MATKEATLKPNKANGLHIDSPKILESSTEQLTPNEIYNLILVLQGIRMANNALPPSASAFIAKNLKKLQAAQEKYVNADVALESEYCEKDAKGRNLYWDGQDERTNAEGNPIPDNEQAINGVKAYYDKTKNCLIDTFTNQPVLGKKANELKQYIVGEGKEAEYAEKRKQLGETKNEVHVMKINHNYLEDYRVNIPTRTIGPGNQPTALNTSDFFEYLIIGAETLPQ